ncbi:hypothetical protein CK203_055358 [Vitis vinifera]|uniref:Uncharacterized protein n=1 Tax=Vitis vinifera TaxID=29760 RepID=A0A438GSV4_VITVI|nr:hypothetical protein CK203_055358 [Vitis vinifera]
MFPQIFYFSMSNFPAMYVELTNPCIAAWNDFLVKQCIKLELEMLGGFGYLARMEATQCQITDAQSHLNSLIASYNRDVKVLRTHFTSSHYRTDEGQPSNCHEHVNESGAPFYTNNPQHSPIHYGGQRISFEDDLGYRNEGVSERPNVEEGVFFANEDPLNPGPHNMLVLVQSCMDNNADVVPQASEEIRPRRVKMKLFLSPKQSKIEESSLESISKSEHTIGGRRNVGCGIAHSTRMSHIWNSAPLTFHPDVSHLEFCSVDIPSGSFASGS